MIPRIMLLSIINLGKGILIGASNVIPGLSGATVAILLGIYENLLQALNSLTTSFPRSIKYLFPIILGMGMGIMSLGSVLKYCLDLFSYPTCSFLAGLVMGSLPMIIRKAAKEIKLLEPRIQWKFVLKNVFFCTLPFMIITVLLSLLRSVNEIVYLEPTSLSFICFLFLGGFLAAGAMIMPGISGAMILMLLGLYSTVLHTITLIKDFLLTPSNFSLLFALLRVLTPLGGGTIIGIWMTSKFITHLLEKHYTKTYFAIVGLIIGTIITVYLDPSTYSSYSFITYPVILSGFVCFGIGMGTVFLFTLKNNI